jgi:hypothetical protein
VCRVEGLRVALGGRLPGAYHEALPTGRSWPGAAGSDDEVMTDRQTGRSRPGAGGGPAAGAARCAASARPTNALPVGVPASCCACQEQDRVPHCAFELSHLLAKARECAAN